MHFKMEESIFLFGVFRKRTYKGALRFALLCWLKKNDRFEQTQALSWAPILTLVSPFCVNLVNLRDNMDREYIEGIYWSPSLFYCALNVSQRDMHHVLRSWLLTLPLYLIFLSSQQDSTRSLLVGYLVWRLQIIQNYWLWIVHKLSTLGG